MSVLTTHQPVGGVQATDGSGGSMSATTINPPVRSLTQRLEALQRANDIRSGRAELKRQIKTMGKPAARDRLAELLHTTPDLIGTMKVYDLLQAAPGYGHVKTIKTLSRAGASPTKTVQGLSRRQRDELVNLLRRAQ